jgi:ABC-2 type transport system permease protein
MSAALAIVGKEWREALRAGGFGWVVVVAAALALAASLTASVARSEAARTIAAAERLEAETWLNQGARNPHAAAHFSRYAVRPSTPLDDVDPGVRAFVGGHVWMEAHLQRPAEARPAEDRVEASVLGPLTPAWIVLHVATLLALFVGAVALARDREEGRLALLHAAAHGPGALVIGKMIAATSLALALGALLVAAATAWPWMQILAGAGVYPDAAFRLAAWSGAAVVLIVVSALLGLVISAFAGTVRAAMLAALIVWALTVLVAPRIAVATAAALAPAPAPATFVASLREDVRAAMDKENAGHGGSASATVLDAQGRVLSARGLRLQRGEEIGDAIFDARYGALNAAYARQDAIRAWFAVMSPGVAFQSLSAGLAGSDYAHHASFLGQAEATRRVIIRTLNEDDIYNAADRGGAYEADRALWSQIPHFTYRAPALGEAGVAWTRDAGALAAWFLASLLAAFAAARAALRRR